MSEKKACPVCEKGHLTEIIDIITVDERDGGEITIPTLSYLCDSCGSEQSDAEQIRLMHRFAQAIRNSPLERLAPGAGLEFNV